MNASDWGKSKRELQEPCDYCKADNSEVLIDENALTAYIEDAILSIEGRGWDGEFQRDDLKINYCPKCRGKLSDK